jgi:hypothetical protein
VVQVLEEALLLPCLLYVVDVCGLARRVKSWQANNGSNVELFIRCNEVAV